MGTKHATIEETLSQGARPLYSAVVGQLKPLLEDESYDQALARLEQIIATVPVDQENRALRAAFLAKRGEIKLDAGRYDEAEEDLRHASHNGLRHPSLWSSIGWAHYQTDRLSKALESFERVLDEDSDHVDALKGRALVFLEMGELERAGADFTHALRIEPGSAHLRALRAQVAARRGALAEAEADIAAARRAEPDDEEYALLHARLIAASGRDAEALAILEQALGEVGALELEALVLRSYLRMKGGDGAGAAADAGAASSRFPDEAIAFVLLALVSLAAGKGAAALKAAERAVKLDPSLPDAYLARGAARRVQGAEAEAEADMERASSAPGELAEFLFGPAADGIDQGAFELGLLEALGAGTQAAPAPSEGGFGAGLPGMGAIPGMGGMDPTKMLGQMFDAEGNIRPAFRPILKMMLKNAPTILKNMPPSMLKGMGGIDPAMLEGVDFANLDPDEVEAQFKQFYQMMKAREGQG